MTALLTPENLLALLSLLALEIVLGVDNIVFIAILTGTLPQVQQGKARRAGLGLAMGMRILLLLGLSQVIKLTQPLFSIYGRPLSGRDLILIGGGLFLIAKTTFEVHATLEGNHQKEAGSKSVSFGGVLIQIALLDIIFSLDSVITAVGMASNVVIMILAVVLAVGVMMAFATPVSEFIVRHPTVKMLALSFLMLVGVVLLADGFGQHIQRGYIYAAMGFSVFVEFLNFRARKRIRKAP